MNGDGVTPWGRISNPFPTGLLMPSGSSLGVMTNLGLGVAEPTRNMGTIAAYSQTWSGGLQYELRGGWLVEANYIGTKGTHLFYYGSGSLQYLGPWVEQEATNANLRAALGTYVANPYYGVINTPGCGICGSTIQVGHLLEPFPQFNGFAQTDWPVANSIYHAFQLKIEKHMSHGLNFMATYTNSKSIDDASLGTSTAWIGGFSSLRDPNDLKLERSLSEWDLPQVLQFHYIWQIPYGRGRHWGGGVNPVVNYILGGWQTSGMWRFDNGQPISIGVTGATSPWGYAASYPDMEARLRRNPKSEWLTEGYFANAAQALIVPPPYSIGNASRVQPNLRVPGTSNATLAIFKDIPLNKMREGSKLQFRMEAFNALNHPQFGGIGTTFGTGTFGDVTAQVNTPRQVQMGLQLYF
jgi:hypothetical protein